MASGMIGAAQIKDKPVTPPDDPVVSCLEQLIDVCEGLIDGKGQDAFHPIEYPSAYATLTIAKECVRLNQDLAAEPSHPALANLRRRESGKFSTGGPCVADLEAEVEHLRRQAERFRYVAMREMAAADSALEGAGQLEVWKARATDAVKTFLAAEGDDLCWMNRQVLANAFGLGGQPSDVRTLPPLEFLGNCVAYCRSLQEGTHYQPTADEFKYAVESAGCPTPSTPYFGPCPSCGSSLSGNAYEDPYCGKCGWKPSPSSYAVLDPGWRADAAHQKAREQGLKNWGILEDDATSHPSRDVPDDLRDSDVPLPGDVHWYIEGQDRGVTVVGDGVRFIWDQRAKPAPDRRGHDTFVNRRAQEFVEGLICKLWMKDALVEQLRQKAKSEQERLDLTRKEADDWRKAWEEVQRELAHVRTQKNVAVEGWESLMKNNDELRKALEEAKVDLRRAGTEKDELSQELKRKDQELTRLWGDAAPRPVKFGDRVSDGAGRMGLAHEVEGGVVKSVTWDGDIKDGQRVSSVKPGEVFPAGQPLPSQQMRETPVDVKMVVHADPDAFSWSKRSVWEAIKRQTEPTPAGSKEIVIPLSHHGQFFEHGPGKANGCWWACFPEYLSRPVEPGDVVRFVFQNAAANARQYLDAQVLWCNRGKSLADPAVTQYGFDDWWVIVYHPIPT